MKNIKLSDEQQRGLDFLNEIFKEAGGRLIIQGIDVVNNGQLHPYSPLKPTVKQIIEDSSFDGLFSAEQLFNFNKQDIEELIKNKKIKYTLQSHSTLVDNIDLVLQHYDISEVPLEIIPNEYLKMVVTKHPEQRFLLIRTMENGEDIVEAIKEFEEDVASNDTLDEAMKSSVNANIITFIPDDKVAIQNLVNYILSKDEVLFNNEERILGYLIYKQLQDQIQYFEAETILSMIDKHESLRKPICELLVSSGQQESLSLKDKIAYGTLHRDDFLKENFIEDVRKNIEELDNLIDLAPYVNVAYAMTESKDIKKLVDYLLATITQENLDSIVESTKENNVQQ